MNAREKVVLRDLDPAEAEAVLARNHVGHMAYIHRGRAEVVPIGYVYDRASIYGRTSAGSKLTALQHDARVAFEASEVDGPLEWRSVIAHALFQPLKPVGSDATAEAWDRAVALLSTVVPGTFAAEDPVPHRWFVFSLKIEDLTGRCSGVGPEDATASTGARRRGSKRASAEDA